MTPITRREWLAALGVALFTALLGLLPYWLGSQSVPDGQFYLHLIMNPEDSLTYWAKMQQGFNGRLLYTIPFTSEPHSPAIVGIFYVALGQMARLTGLSLVAIWHFSRFVAALILFLTIFATTAVYLPHRTARWTAYLLALYGSGLGWLLLFSGQSYWLGAFPVDFKQPGAHIFFTSLTYPHIILGTALILTNVLILQQIANQVADHGGNGRIWRNAVLAGIANLLLGLAYPFLLYIVIVTAVLLYSYLLWQQRRFLWRTGWQIALLFLIPAPLYLHFVTILYNNPIFRIWDAQAGTPSPPWPHYLVAFGPMLLLALLLWWKRPSTRPHFAVLYCWIIAVVLLVYAPLNPQRRFVQGIHVALAILSAAALVDLLLPRLQRTAVWQRIIANPRYTTTKLTRFILLLLLLFLSFSNLLLLADASRIAALTRPDLFFRPLDELDAAHWLDANTPDTAVVLGSYQTGNFIPAYAGNRTVLGHWAETAHITAKETAVAQFFASSTSHTTRQELLTQENVAYLWYGPREQALGSFNPQTAPYLQPLYSNPTITLYTTTPEPKIPNN